MSERICTVPDCGRKHFGNGYCQGHHRRFRVYGDPLARHGFASDIERFWSKVDKSDQEGCWPWTAAKDRDGYGHFKVKKRMWRASRWIFEQVNGSLISSEVVRHHCDNPPCVRPDHLLRGTVLDNATDAVARGRTATGSRQGSYTKPETRMPGMKNAQAKLTDAQVIDIRRRYAAGELQVPLAAEFGVSQLTVSVIVRRKTWRHLKE